MSYVLEGTYWKCAMNILCPCWVGEDPDNGECDSVNTYQIRRGQIDGVDVSVGHFVLDPHPR